MPPKRRSSLGRMLAVLDLFTPDRPVATTEEAAARIGCSVATAYRYVAELAAAGLVARAAGGFTLGARIIELDYTIRQRDRLSLTALPVMRELRDRTGCDVLLTAMYGARIIAVHHERGTDPTTVSFTRGRPMPLFRGAGSKVIMAEMPAARLRRVYQDRADEIAAAGLGTDWAAFRAAMAAIRRDGHAISLGELDPHNVGIAAPLRHDSGSLVAVMSRPRWSLADQSKVVDVVTTAAARISALLRDPAVAEQVLPLRGARNG